MASGTHKGFYHGGICLITDRDSCSLTPFEMAYMALSSGLKWIQYREKHRNRRGTYRMALALRELTRDFGAFFVVNDHADIAAAVEADGVHLGQEDLPVAEARKVMGPHRVIGISTHSEDEARRAEAEGADYIGFGPVFGTSTKDAGTPRGVERLRRISRAVNIPLVAIGGISADNCGEVLGGGASAVAAASSILRGDIARNASAMLGIISRCSGGR